MNITREKEFIFIIGSPRSGTTWIQVLLASHPSVCATVELTLFSKYVSPMLRAWDSERENIRKGRWIQGLPVVWKEEDFQAFIHEFIEKTYRNLLEKNPQATHILDKHPGYTFHLDEIRSLIPHARFIHILRDGRDVAVSMINARKKVGHGTDNVPDSALNWRRHVEAARMFCKDNPACLEIRYESLLEDCAGELERVFEFCRLPASREMISRICEENTFDRLKALRKTGDKELKAREGHYWRGKKDNWQQEFTPYDRYLFHRAAGDLLCELGYAEPDWWVGNKLDETSLPLLFFLREGVAARLKRLAQRVIPI